MQLSRRHYALAAGLAALTLCLGLTRIDSNPSSGERLFASGEVQLSTGLIQRISHSLQIEGDRFYCITRQGDSVVQTSGRAQQRFFGGYDLHVEEGEIINLKEQAHNDDTLLFNLLYAQHSGSQISLEPINGCLHSVQTQQLFCPQSNINSAAADSVAGR